MIVAIALFCAGCLLTVTVLYKVCSFDKKLKPKPEPETIVTERLAQAQTQRTEALSEANRALERANETLRTFSSRAEIGSLASEAFRNAWVTMSTSGFSMRDITGIQTALRDAGLRPSAQQNSSMQIYSVSVPTAEASPPPKPPPPPPPVETIFDHLRKDTDDSSI